jgi:3-hydroxyisobutyrate dehydrogenase-like beta-hydroxyacid dehydrogenase
MQDVIGFIGLGNMGLPMAGRLIDAGYSLRVYNRTAAKAEPLRARGATIVSQPADVAEPGAMVVSMLANDAAVEQAVSGENGVLSRLGPGGIHVSMSTIAPATARTLAEQHRKAGAAYLAAPVFGRPDAAEAGKLWIVLAGPVAAKTRAHDVLAVLGQGSFDYGEDPERANVVKLAGNFLIASAMEAMAEAFTLAEKHGVDRTELADMFGKTLFPCPIYQNYGKAIAGYRHQPAGFKMSLGLKDLDLILATAAEGTAPMPLASLLYNRMLSGVARQRGDIDWSGIALSVSEDAGTR